MTCRSLDFVETEDRTESARVFAGDAFSDSIEEVSPKNGDVLRLLVAAPLLKVDHCHTRAYHFLAEFGVGGKLSSAKFVFVA